MAYTKKQFLEDVAKEAIALKEHATKKEIKHLSFENLNPDSKYNCIYGQMTGDCTSKRASELIFSCCKRYIKNTSYSELLDFNSIKKNVNGERIDGVETPKDLQNDRVFMIDHLSSIEAYIQMTQAKNKNLIDFLKGDTSDLKL